MLRLPLLVATVASLAIAAPAQAALVTRVDNQRRPMTFDVRSRNGDVNWYAGLLRRAVHGDEISDLVVQIVPRGQITWYCGRGAGSCYEGGRRGVSITVPAGRSVGIASLLLHEYAHHLDSSYGLTRDSSRWGWGREPDQAERWWAARRIELLLTRGRVSPDYDLGWERSIPEILAEDYVRLHLPSRWQLRWLAAPSRPVRAALRADIREALRSGSSSAP